MRGKPFKFKRLLIGGSLLMAMAMVWVVFFYRPAPNLPALPDPNGYDVFERAGMALSEDPPITHDIETNSIGQLERLILANSKALRLLAEGAEMESRVPLYAEDDLDVTRAIMTKKQLARLRSSEARLARLMGETNEAARISMEIIKFGQESSRGGPMIHYLVGIGCSWSGFDQLKRAIPGLTAAQCRSVIRRLKELEVNQATAESVIEAERAWLKYNHGYKGSFALMWAKRSTRPFESFRSDMQGKRDEFQRWIEEARIRAAAQAYLLEKGMAPTNVAVLAPEFLSGVPVDPETGKPMTLPK